VVGGGPVTPEVPALQQDVGAGHDPAVGRGDHRGVVAGADPDRRSGGETGGELPDEPELTELPNSALHCPFAPSLPVRARSRVVRVLATVDMTVNFSRACTPARKARFPQVSPRRAATRYRGVPFPHMILVAALEVPWYRRTS